MSKPIDEQLKELGKRWNTDKENELLYKLAEARALLGQAKERYKSYNTDVILSSFWKDWLAKLNEFLGEK